MASIQVTRWSTAALAIVTFLAASLAGCTSHASSSSVSTPALEPVATLQDLMTGQIDPAADALWDSVGEEVSKSGDVQLQPHTDAEWQTVRQHALTLIEGANLLLVPGRRLSAHEFPPEAPGVYGSTEIAGAIAANRLGFAQFAVALRAVGQQALDSIDARDPKGLMNAGETLDGICESCHTTFWYPNQRVPSR
jgi:hypothetical protein